MENLILSPISLGELRTVISETVESELKKQFTLINKPEQTEYISRKESAKILGVSLVTLSHWQKKGLVSAYRINSRVRYKRAEVLNSLAKIESKSYGGND